MKNSNCPSFFMATPFSVTIAVISSAGVTSKLGLYIPSRLGGVIMTTACSFSPRAFNIGGCNAPRTRHASNCGLCSMGILRKDMFHDESGRDCREGLPCSICYVKVDSADWGHHDKWNLVSSSKDCGIVRSNLPRGTSEERTSHYGEIVPYWLCPRFSLSYLLLQLIEKVSWDP